MNARQLMVLTGCISAGLWFGGVAIAAEKAPPATTQWDNRQADGTYLLVTDDPRSIQAYYRDVGMGPLILPTTAKAEEMRETCLALGDHWRPLGHVPMPDPGGKSSYPLDLCFYGGPNPDDLARQKCASLGRPLVENRAHRREIVCGPRNYAEAAQQAA